MLRKGHGGLDRAPTKEERRKWKAKRERRERDQVKFMDLWFERWQVVRFRKARRDTFYKQNTMQGKFAGSSCRVVRGLLDGRR